MTDDVASHPYARKAVRRLLRAGINEGVEAIVETLHPRPRGADTLPVADMERALADWVDDTVRIAVHKTALDVLREARDGDGDVLLAEAEARYRRVLDGFEEGE